MGISSALQDRVTRIADLLEQAGWLEEAGQLWRSAFMFAAHNDLIRLEQVAENANRILKSHLDIAGELIRNESN